MMSHSVLHVDNHVLVLEKPAGLRTQPDGTDEPSLEGWGKAWLKEKFQKPGNVFLHTLHRLDCPVSGIVLFARTSKSLSRLNLFNRESRFQKEYLALVEGAWEKKEGQLEHYLVQGDRCALVVTEDHPGAKRAVLKYRVLKVSKNYTCLQITLMTGRYHQIRAQFAAEGHPIVGDLKYGSTLLSTHLCLHHAVFTFPHPITQSLHTCYSPVKDNWFRDPDCAKEVRRRWPELFTHPPCVFDVAACADTNNHD